MKNGQQIPSYALLDSLRISAGLEVPVPDPEAVLIVRAWFECAHPRDFRARIRGVHLDDPEATRATTTPDEVMEIVRS
jgi:hypothetical protein